MRFLTKTSLLHTFAWISAVAYLLFSPSIYAHWFVDEGKAIHSSKPSSVQKTTEFKAHIDLLVLYNKKGVYELEGWGFLLDNLPIQEFSREIILVSPTNYLVFETESVKRQDVENHFPSIEKDLTMAGLKAKISKYVVPVGHYHIMLSFKQKDGQVIYANTNFCVTRTPNQFLLLDRSKCTGD